ncbi:PREDICTED: uncharacterized protein LOC109582851 [Amphimedon queenslandica]|uniref:Uncharacterized protein n=1 Tax=Amphimedon queenslandica TaxID=400682 RepID=A0A1X7UL94_AMPQE|nr:PREDICTED: uncharacterized protein LOC109582851 [Amphimedon queenslandica]|eukprot:XP_019853418.1 PREDICTED: uncharacterized protein LOC109582851 [Amphimedon queenslandica]
MAGMKDINVAYVNATGQTDFEVVVFTKNFNINTPNVYYAAWKILRGQAEIEFVYPASMKVSATYTSSGQIVKAGPFPSKLGSTWEITQDSISSTATLKEVKAPTNPNGSIVIRNIPPATWSGNMFDLGVYKNGSLLVIEKDVLVGNQVGFLLKPKLYFGVVRNLVEGDIFTSLEITSFLTEFDLTNYPNGLKVTLNFPVGGEYVFSGEAMS